MADVNVYLVGENTRLAIRAAGGSLSGPGDFIPGEPYVFFKDPDGYDVEIWYEIPTPVDPPRKPKTRKTRQAKQR